ncbi:MAG: thioesterase family protein [Muribaculaceae bacterium]|nr:thioesterase family protein [Muribaculaceae bacterium]
MSGTSHISRLVVSESHTAAAMGSGDIAVLATPALVALMENAALTAARQLQPEGHTTVGSHIDVRHLRPSPVGSTVEAQAELQEQDGNKLTFKIVATMNGQLVGEAVHTRHIVSRQQFLDKLNRH